MTVIEFEKSVVTSAEGVLALPLDAHGNGNGAGKILDEGRPGAALLASAAGAGDLVDGDPVTDAAIIAAFEARTRPLDPDQYV
jgi:hypothetical protein